MAHKLLAVFGEKYSNTDSARSLFPETAGAKVHYYPKMEDIFKAVDSGKALWGIVPRENSNAGKVTETQENFKKYPQITILSVQKKKIEHHLLGLRGADVQAIARIFSHAQALNQCRTWLQKNLPVVLLEETSSTATAARNISESKDKTRAAIASRSAAEAYGLDILAENIQSPNNVTEFILVCKKK